MTNGKIFTFSDRAIGKLPPFTPRPDSKTKADEYSHAKVSGLKVAVNAKRECRFLFRYMYRSKKCALSIGIWPATKVKDAESIALSYRAMLDRDMDPAVERNRRRETPTFREFAEEYYLPLAYQEKRSARDDESRLGNHVYKKIGGMVLSDIRNTDIEELLYAVKKVASASTANRIRSLVSSVMRRALEASYITDNPVKLVRKLKEVPYTATYLTLDEAQKLLIALDEEPNVIMASALKMLLLTGCRRNEIIQARWDDIDFTRQELTLRLTKNGESRQVPLNDGAMAVLKEIPRRHGNPFVFPGNDRNPTNPKNKGKELHKPVSDPRKVLERALTRAGLGRMRIHDCRHSMATICVNSGIDLYVLQRLLGHLSPNTTAKYAHVANQTLHKATAKIGDLLTKKNTDQVASIDKRAR